MSLCSTLTQTTAQHKWPMAWLSEASEEGHRQPGLPHYELPWLSYLNSTTLKCLCKLLTHYAHCCRPNQATQKANSILCSKAQLNRPQDTLQTQFVWKLQSSVAMNRFLRFGEFIFNHLLSSSILFSRFSLYTRIYMHFNHFLFFFLSLITSLLALAALPTL